MLDSNKNQDLVTIVTVTYNAEEVLEETILSIINQNYKNIEYIIIDGSSTDKTLNIIKKHEDNIHYWISEPDEGIYFAMNKAIEKANGKWINFMNAGDTFFDLDTVSFVMKQKDNEAELIYGNFQIKENGSIRKAHDKSQWHLYSPFCHQTLFTKTDIMREECFNTSFKLASDQNFIIKMYHDKKKFFYLDKTIAIFALGGFAESNLFLSYIESIKVLLDNKVPEEEIKKSYWYLALIKNTCLKEKNHITTLKQKLQKKDKIIQDQVDDITQLSTLYNTIQQITSYSILKTPLQKYKTYKIMLKTYWEIQKFK